MAKRMILAGAVAGVLGLYGAAAEAADLSDGPRYGSAYEDPRYRGIYGDEEPAYRDRYREERRYLPPMRDERPRRYSEYDDGYDRNGDGCMPKRQIRLRLERQGWGDFHNIDLRPRIAFFDARRPDGRLYRLKIDRCSGEVLQGTALDGPRWRGRPYAYGSRRYDREYWN